MMEWLEPHNTNEKSFMKEKSLEINGRYKVIIAILYFDNGSSYINIRNELALIYIHTNECM